MGLIVGLLTVVTSPWTLATLILAVPAVAIIVQRPEVGALAVICLSLVVPRDTLYRQGISLGGGSLKITDLLILLTVGAWLAQRAIHPGARAMPSIGTRAAVVALSVVGVLGVVTSAERGGSLQLALTDFRPFLSLLLLFPLVAFVVDRRTMLRALVAILVACGAGGVWIAVLYLNGEGSEASFAGGALRVTEVAFVAPMIGAVWVFVLLPHCRAWRSRVLLSVLAVVCMSALFFTLQRGAWLSLAAAAVIGAVMMTPRRRASLLGAVLALAVGAGVAIVALNAASSARVDNPLQSGLERVQSVGAFQTDVSALHREAETRAAFEQIRKHPVTGIGLGGALTFFSPLSNPATGRSGVRYTTTYLHNSYTWMAVKTGLAGLLALLVAIGLVLARAARLATRAREQFVRVGALGAFASLASLAVVSLTGPHLTSDLGMPYVVAMVAGVECLWRLNRADVGG